MILKPPDFFSVLGFFAIIFGLAACASGLWAVICLITPKAFFMAKQHRTRWHGFLYHVILGLALLIIGSTLLDMGTGELTETSLHVFFGLVVFGALGYTYFLRR